MASIKSLEKAFAILEAFSPANKRIGIAELSQIVGMPRPTVSRIISTLVKLGYMEQEPKGHKYKLSLRILTLANIVQAGLDLQKVAMPVLQRLRDQVEETVYMDVVDGDERVCVCSLTGTQAVRTFVEVGQRSPLHAGADSRLILASLTDDKIKRYIERTGLKPLTNKTIKEEDCLWEEINKIRQTNMSVSAGEYNPGSACISVPIRDFSGKFVAGLSVSYPVTRDSPEIFNKYSKAIKEASLELSRLLGYKQNLD
ncbi:MAG: hypothetical protein JL56_10665 [Desulfotomaculum sp. BICA1-6]|nr:MAG: hypothetical protein VR67_06830 [Peptococcaceae bacterium BRH_c8a]KJS73556.1 MAG: hypothetical protein JL56_10665 [Desulfotomaculum sp. BICA1-6]